MPVQIVAICASYKFWILSRCKI